MKTISKLFLLLSIILLSSCDETELDQTVTNQVNPKKDLKIRVERKEEMEGCRKRRKKYKR